MDGWDERFLCLFSWGFLYFSVSWPILDVGVEDMKMVYMQVMYIY